MDELEERNTAQYVKHLAQYVKLITLLILISEIQNCKNSIKIIFFSCVNSFPSFFC